MATLTISLASTPLTGSKAFTLSDADASRFIAWAQAAYPGPNDVNGSPTVLTPGQALVAWASGIAAGTVANVTSYGKNAAAATAVAGVAPVSIA